ncbi:MAG: lysophospholipid acyltransferase family protein [Acidobacteriota bacterium]
MSDADAPSVSTSLRPLPHLDDEPVTRWLCRGLSALARRRVVSLEGVEHVAPELDPFLLASNHSQRLEAVLLPAFLVWHRYGRLLHFFGDWPMMMVPGVGLIYRHSGIIPVATKSARFKVLDMLRPLYCPPTPAVDRARDLLAQGRSVGVFPEGTMNRHPRQLLRGRLGCARLAIDAGVPVVPMGIRFPSNDGRAPISDFDTIAVRIGPPLTPPTGAGRSADVRSFHEQVMNEIAQLCDKSWSPKAPRRKQDVDAR